MEIDVKTFSTNLAHYRKEKGLSQMDLSKLTNISGRMIAHYEKHITYPSIEKINILAKALGIDAATLLGLTKKRQQESQMFFDVRILKRFKKILLLNPKDRSAVYKYVDNLLKDDEYDNVRKDISTLAE